MRCIRDRVRRGKASSCRHLHCLRMLHVAVLLVLLRSHSGTAKRVSGDFRLSGVHTEHILTSFAVVPEGAVLEGILSSKQMYENEHALAVRAIRDTEWRKFQKSTLCSERIQLSKYNHPVKFERVDDQYEAKIFQDIDNVIQYGVDHLDNSRSKGEQKLADNPRNHYWYFVVTDCSLEQYFQDNRIPDLHFDFTVQNYRQRGHSSYRSRNHLSADHIPLPIGHALTFLGSGFITMILVFKILWRLGIQDQHKHNSVHAAVLWVTLAAVLDSTSSFLELIHIQIYTVNGVGSYLFDALSAHCEAICDAALTILLLSIASGWTLPSSVVTVVNTNASPVQKLLHGLSHPISSGIKSTSGAAMAAIVGWYVLLAQLGRMSNDDFDSYHDLDHFPGSVLMWTRMLAGMLFLGAVRISSAKFPPALQKFYTYFTAAGLFWFLSLPALTWICNVFVPYYKKRPTVFIASTVLQSGSLVLLSWLVTTHSTAYHQYSRMSNSEETLTDNLAAAPPPLSPSTDVNRKGAWMLGKKAKVRLD
jgi:Rhodopsin-like GPCR transmembrane domain